MPSYIFEMWFSPPYRIPTNIIDDLVSVTYEDENIQSTLLLDKTTKIEEKVAAVEKFVSEPKIPSVASSDRPVSDIGFRVIAIQKDSVFLIKVLTIEKPGKKIMQYTILRNKNMEKCLKEIVDIILGEPSTGAQQHTRGSVVNMAKSAIRRFMPHKTKTVVGTDSQLNDDNGIEDQSIDGSVSSLTTSNQQPRQGIKRSAVDMAKSAYSKFMPKRLKQASQLNGSVTQSTPTQDEGLLNRHRRMENTTNGTLGGSGYHDSEDSGDDYDSSDDSDDWYEAE